MVFAIQTQYATVKKRMFQVHLSPTLFIGIRTLGIILGRMGIM